MKEEEEKEEGTQKKNQKTKKNQKKKLETSKQTINCEDHSIQLVVTLLGG